MGAGRPTWQRIMFGAFGLVLVVATFGYFLPKIADYRDVWDVLEQLTWPWILALIGATILNIVTFAPPWQVALPGLRFLSALTLTQLSTALSIVFPGGAAVGIASSFGVLRSWGFPSREIGRAVTLVSLWNQFANLSYPVIAIFLLSASGGNFAVLQTAAFVGAGVLFVAVAMLVAVLASDELATNLGDLSARSANWVKDKLRRGPVAWSGESFEQFRRDSLDLLRRRWHLLTLATYVGTLSVFLVLLISLRALGVPASEVSWEEAFAAWALARLLGSIPITPGGVGVVELGLTGALLAFGGNNAGVVAAVLLYRFLTMVPTLLLGLIAAASARRREAHARA
jgi:putative heme transporter